MKLRSKIIWLIAIALSVSPVCTFGRNSEPQTLDEQPVLRLEQDWLKALTERDRVSLNRILADEFVDCSWHGELRTKQQILAELGERAAYPQRLDDLKVSRYQQTAIVRGINIVTDQTGRVLTRIRFTDVFIYRGGHWQAVAAQETEIKT
jgi:hypothetical protein